LFLETEMMSNSIHRLLRMTFRIIRSAAAIAIVAVLLVALNITLGAIINGKSLIGRTAVSEGIVSAVYDSGNFDAGLRLQGDPNRYYINRGLQHRFTIEELRQTLLGKKARLYYVDQFIILDPHGRQRHINQIRLGKELVFTELKEPEP